MEETGTADSDQEKHVVLRHLGGDDAPLQRIHDERTAEEYAARERVCRWRDPTIFLRNWA